MSDTIEFECPYCQKRSRVPRAYAGRRGQCPGCQQILEVPHPDEPALDSDSGCATNALEADTKACPMCGETIKKVAKKCKHCKSVLDARLRQQSRASSLHNEAAAKAERLPSTADWLVVFLCPGIACIVGIVVLFQGYSRRGGMMIGVSLLWGFVVNVLRAALEAGARM